MVKKRLLLFPVLFFVLLLQANDYNTYFSDGRIRMNYTIQGNSAYQEILEHSYILEGVWGGSKANLVDTFRYGRLMLEVYDFYSNKLIYSRGYSNLFQEWQTIAEAKTTVKKFRECVLFPRPKNKVKIIIHARDSNLVFQPFFKTELDPAVFPVTSDPSKNQEYQTVHGHYPSHKALDIVFVSEGYTSDQKDKFIGDVERFRDNLFRWKPYSLYQNRINVHAVFLASEEQGVDIPGDSIWKSTWLDATFYTFGIERYMSVPDLTKVYDYLSGVPIDQLCVLINSEKYGGGGIYNFYNIFTSDNERAAFLFIHEFGHGFAGLADEYFSSEVAYEDFVRTDLEPVEPNITTLVDFAGKWASLVHDSIPVPTPDKSQYDNVIGVFEGASYQAKDVYRPARDCAMKTSTYGKFCPVCTEHIIRMIGFYSY